MNKKMSQFLAICTICVISWVIVQSPVTGQYVERLTDNKVAFVAKSDNRLEEQIKNASSRLGEEPKDAVIDRVWKKTPGYNGLEVDIKKSLKRMEKHGSYDEEMLIYKQISPKVKLKDLPPSPIYRGNPNKPAVAFVINVAWGNEYIPHMLKTLKKHNLQTSFVLEGRWTKNNRSLAKRIGDAGHELGNHSYTHPDMQKLSLQSAKKEIADTNEVIRHVTGKTPAVFGPPSGSFNEATVQAASSLGMETILWTVDTVDWKKPAPDILIKRVLSKVHNGALILMHPTASTEEALDTLITSLQKDYRIVTISELISEERVKP